MGHHADDVVPGAAIARRYDVDLVAADDRPATATPSDRRSPAYSVGVAPLELAPAQWSDRDLLSEVVRLAACEREATSALVALLAEVDARRLHLAEGCGSLFAYCTERLHLSEHAAYHRIEAARAARAFPVILDHLRDGSLTLTAVTLLWPHLTVENHGRLVAAACGRSKREVEVLVRGVAPQPDVPASVRRLPAASSVAPGAGATARAGASGWRGDTRDDASRSAAASHPASKEHLAAPDASLPLLEAGGNAAGAASRVPPASRPAEVRVLAPERYSLRVTLSADGHARLRRAQDLLRHAVPDADPAAIVERALAVLVEQLERTKFAARRTRSATGGRGAKLPTGTPPRSAADGAVSVPRTLPVPGAVPAESPASVAGRRSGRRIPAAVRRAVWKRDEGRCAFRGAGGRCRETGRLEFHHRIPVADGGPASVNDVELLCTAHHAYQTTRWFGQAQDPGGGEPGDPRTRSGPS
jgi:hypothetical protein